MLVASGTSQQNRPIGDSTPLGRFKDTSPIVPLVL